MTMPSEIVDITISEPLAPHETPEGEPIFLTDEQVIHINQRLTEARAEGESHELVQPSLLSSALARVRLQWESGEHDVAILAGHLLLGIGISAPFGAANERTALTAAKVFLHFNGYSLVAPDAEPLSRLVERSISGAIPEGMFLRAMRASAIPTDEWRAFQASQQ